MKSVILIITAFFLLFSCINIESEISINENDSGTFLITYRISRMVNNLGRKEDEKNIIQLPDNSEELQAVIEGIDGLSFESFDKEEKAGEISVTISLEFENIDALSTLFAYYTDTMLILDEEGTGSVLQYTIYKSKEGSIDSETYNLMNLLIPEYSLSFEISAPDEITSSKIISNTLSEGSIRFADSGNSVKLHIYTAEVIKNNNTIIWEVVW